MTATAPIAQLHRHDPAAAPARSGLLGETPGFAAAQDHAQTQARPHHTAQTQAKTHFQAQPAGHPLARPIGLLLALLLVLAPLFRGGAAPLAGLVLHGLSLTILVAALWHPRQVPLRRLEILLLLALPLTVLAYLIPLPAAWVAALPGRDLQTAAEALLPASALGAWQPLSLNPTATLNAGLALLVPLAVFVGSRALDTQALTRLVQLLLLIACGEALLGLVQYTSSQSGQMLFALEGGHRDTAIGTFLNRNHLAGLLVMALSLALALLFSSLGRDAGQRAPGTWRRRAAFLGSRQGTAALAYGGAALLLLLGVIFSRSRAGIATAMLGLILSTLLYARRIGGRNAFGFTGTFVALVLGLGLAIGLAPVLDRFSLDPAEDGRVAIFGASLTAIGQRLPLGSGPGTYPDAIRPFQEPAVFGNQYINHAHNDYLEWVADAGLVAPVLIVLALILYLRHWPRVHSREEWSRTRFLQAGAGIGLLLLALHEVVDYNLVTPANQAVFALLAALFLRPPEQPETATSARRLRRRRTPDLVTNPTTAAANPAPRARANPDPANPVGKTPPTQAEQIVNPFTDP